MEVYLIDFENVHSEGIKDIDKLKMEDEVYIFYTSNADTITIKAHQNISKSLATVRFFNVTSGGKNALDFQLSSFLGYIIASRKDCEKIYIVTNDNGFLFTIKFWKSNFKNLKTDIIKISAISDKNTNNISNDVQEQKTLIISPPLKDNLPPIEVTTTQIKATPHQQSNSNNSVPPQINTLLQKQCSKNEMLIVVTALKKSTDKNTLNVQLGSLFGKERGNQIYYLLRSNYAEIKKVVK